MNDTFNSYDTSMAVDDLSDLKSSLNDMARLTEQVRLEEDALQSARLDFNEQLQETHKEGQLLPAERAWLQRRCIEPLTAAIAQARVDQASHRGGRSLKVLQRYRALGSDVLALATLNVLLQKAWSTESRQKIAVTLATFLDLECCAVEVDARGDIPKGTAGLEQRKAARTEALRRLEEADGHALMEERAKVGLWLLQAALNALPTSFEERELPGGLIGIGFAMEAEAELARLIKIAANKILPGHQPMLVAPRDWSSIHSGGYYTLPGSAVKLRPSSNRWNRDYGAEIRRDPPQMALQAINHLQKTRWQIDSDILDIMNEFQHRWADAALAERRALTKRKRRSKTGTSRDEAQTECASVADEDTDRDYNNIKGPKFLTFQRMLATASRYQKLDAPLHFVWTLDYRGRAYPSGGLVQPQGKDDAVALLRFHDTIPLGANGERWLAWHGSNVLDCPKEAAKTLDGRQEWIARHEVDILAAARDPRGTLPFWSGTSDEKVPRFHKTAWRALAFCREWAAFKAGGRRFESSLPVSIDGTCNAIQHLACLTGDEKLAEQVNLRPRAEKQDIYGHVADRLRQRLTSTDVAQRHKHYEDFLALCAAIGVEGPELATRSLCKQPVMTRPYGATETGVFDQISGDLRETYPAIERFRRADLNRYGRAIGCLRDNLITAMAAEMPAAERLMRWLQKTAAPMAGVSEAMCWRSPIGFEVMQAIEKTVDKPFNTRLKYPKPMTRQVMIKRPTGRLCPVKSRNSIVPNFVHSLDASHMMATAVAAKAHGIQALRMVHDSFGTHAGHMETLSGITRRTFVDLYHGADPIHDYYTRCNEVLKARHRDPLPEPPPRGSFDVREVLSSTYFFC